MVGAATAALVQVETTVDLSEREPSFGLTSRAGGGLESGTQSVARSAHRAVLAAFGVSATHGRHDRDISCSAWRERVGHTTGRKEVASIDRGRTGWIGTSGLVGVHRILDKTVALQLAEKDYAAGSETIDPGAELRVAMGRQAGGAR